MSEMKNQEWTEITLTLTPEDIKCLESAIIFLPSWASSGVLEHIVTLAKDKQYAKLIKEQANV